MRKVFKILCAVLCCTFIGMGLVGCGNTTPPETPPAQPPAVEEPTLTPSAPQTPTTPEQPTTPVAPVEPVAPETPTQPTETPSQTPTETEEPAEPEAPAEPTESEEDKTVKTVVEIINAWLKDNGLVYVSTDELECVVENGNASITILAEQTEDFEVLEYYFLEEPPIYGEEYSIEFNYTSTAGTFTITKK